jgi:hypothetical protein
LELVALLKKEQFQSYKTFFCIFVSYTLLWLRTLLTVLRNGLAYQQVRYNVLLQRFYRIGSRGQYHKTFSSHNQHLGARLGAYPKTGAQRCKGLIVTNTLAYCVTESVSVLKCFVKQAQGVTVIKTFFFTKPA